MDRPASQDDTTASSAQQHHHQQQQQQHPPPPSPSPFFASSPYPSVSSSSHQHLQQHHQPLLPFASPLVLAPFPGRGGPLTPYTEHHVMQGLLLPSPSAAMAALSGGGAGDHEGEHEEEEEDGAGMELEDDGLWAGEVSGMAPPPNHSLLDMTPAALLRLPLQQGQGQDDPLLHLLATYVDYGRAFTAVVAGDEAMEEGALPSSIDAARTALAALRPMAAPAAEANDKANDDDDGTALLLLVARAFVGQAQAALDNALAEARALAADEAAFWGVVEEDAGAWEAEGTRRASAALSGVVDEGKGKNNKKKKGSAAKATVTSPPRPPSAASSSSASRSQHPITKLSASSTAPLIAWLLAEHPGKTAPSTAAEKAALARASGLTEKQVLSWFSNFKCVRVRLPVVVCLVVIS